MPSEAEILQSLADVAGCTSGDLHTLHFNISGEDFDTMHKKVLKKYYEEAAEDQDNWSEWKVAFKEPAANPLYAADRIQWQKQEYEQVDRRLAIEKVSQLLEQYCESMRIVFKAWNSKTDCPLKVGICNALQTRLEYWAKEMAYFNERRK